jgi:ribulose-phosphate 3-epimerase
MTQVVPALIPHTKAQLEEEISKVSGFAPTIQIDVSDGDFTPIKTWPYNGRDTEYFEKLKGEEEGLPKWQDIDFEIHLMVRNPENVLSDWIKTGAGTIVAHIEATDDFQKVIDMCRESQVSVGVAIKPGTDFSKLEKVISEVDFVQVMGSDELGKHGVELEESAIEMIKKLRRQYPDCIIAIDIGVNEESAEMLTSIGVSKLITGSAVLDAENPEEVFKYFSSL